MKKLSKNAIEILNKHFKELDSITNTQQAENWKAHIKDTLVKFLGNDTSFLKRLEELKFTKTVSSTYPGIIGIFTDEVFDEVCKANFKNLIESVKSHIEYNGIKILKNDNILGKFSNFQLIAGFITLLPVLYSFCVIIYNARSEQQQFKYETEIKVLKDSIQNLTQKK